MMKSVQFALVLATSALISPIDFAAAQTRSPNAIIGTGTCATTAMRYKVSAGGVASTNKIAFSNLAEVATTFTQGSPGCVVVTFSAETQVNNPPNSLLVQAVLDRTTNCDPAPMVFAGAPGDVATSGTSTTVFYCANVPAGARRIDIQFASSAAGKEAVILTRSIKVEYVK